VKPLAIAIVSGGMDSVTLAHLLHDEGWALHLLAVNYGQRHIKELEYARRCADRLGAQFTVADLSNLVSLLGGSALTDRSIDVPLGHYAEPSMAATVVPNRNAIMLSIAYGLAVSIGAERVATGVHAGDHPIYPDCRPRFIAMFEAMERLATEGYSNPQLHLYTPFVKIGKQDICAIGTELDVPYEETWSCYQGGDVHCGRCGTCVERKEAFQLAGVPDPTVYADGVR
jgi:7-cyano-7-deazaguanine synthase